MDINDKIIDHYRHPRNFGVLEQPDGFSYYQEPGCRDNIKFSVNINENDIITNVKATAEGCAYIIACTSLLTTLVKDKTLKKAWKLESEQISMELEDLPAEKMHCADVAIYALRKAITDFLKINGRAIEDC